MRVLSSQRLHGAPLVVLVALLGAAPVQAQTSPSAPAANRGSAAILITATGIAAPIRSLAEQSAVARVSAAGYARLDPAAVTAMMRTLRVRTLAGVDAATRLGKALLASAVVTVDLTRRGTSVRVAVAVHDVAAASSRGRTVTAPLSEMLPRLATELDTALGAPVPTPTPPVSPATQPAAPAASAPTTPPPLPPLSVPEPPPLPAITPRAAAGSGAPLGVVATAGTEAAVADPWGPDTIRFIGAVGFGVAAFFDEKRVGPAFDVEIGATRHNFRLAALFRAIIGDATAYVYGLRFDAGPRFGRFRLNFGADAGVMHVPGAKSRSNLLGAFAVRPLAGIVRWQHLQLAVTLVSIDFYAGPGDADKASAFVGLSSGVSLAFY